MLRPQTVVTGVDTQRKPSEGSLAKATVLGNRKWAECGICVYTREDIKHKPGTDNITKTKSSFRCGVSALDMGKPRSETDSEMEQTLTHVLKDKLNIVRRDLLFMSGSSQEFWSDSAAGSSGNPPQMFQEPGPPAAGQVCSKLGVC